MYQVYHKNSTAGSTANWGYDAILSPTNKNKYKTEVSIINQLSTIIDNARRTLDEKQRIKFYAEALDLVMDLAVELPTYQRSDLFAYNTNIIDVNTLTPADELTPYNGPMSRIWEVGLNETEK
jgi:peptide/nickel transport system substrate-binding protein